MAASNRILGEQDVAWVQQEVLAVAGLEVQCAAQRDDELPDRGGVPIKRAAGCRLLKRNGRRGEFSGQEIGMRTGFESSQPSSKYEFWSSPVQRRTHRIIYLPPDAVGGLLIAGCRVRVRLTAHKATA